MELSSFKWNLQLVILIVSVLQIRAQETKGGGFISVNSQSSSQTKGGSSGGFSSFRESIESFKRQQQQQVAQPIGQTNIVKETVSSFSSSAVQRPVTLSQQSIVVEQQEQQQQQQNGLAQPEPALYGGVAGTPGVDFPNYVNIPNTRFKCDGLPFNPGMYADETTGCQVYHLCYQGRMESFLCGIGTVFNQAIMNCDFWHSVDCSKSSQYYQLNANFGKSLGEPATLQQSRAQQVSSKTSSRVEGSSFVQLTQPQPPVLTDTSFVSRQSSSNTVQRPALINAIQSSSEFSSSRLSSQPAQLEGKTSIRREEQNFRSSGGLLSPSRQRQQFNLDSNSGQFTSESSTQIRVMSSDTMENETSDRSSVSVGSSLVVADDGPARPQHQAVLEKPSLSKTQRKTSSLSSTSSSSSSSRNQDDGGWKPYFKSKTNPRPSSSTASPALVSTSTTSISTPAIPRPSEPAAISQPDQEPVFSRQSTTTTESPASSASIEPDVGPATAATETPSIPTTVTTPGQPEADTPVKSVAPPPTEEPSTEPPAQQTTTTTTAPTTSTEAPTASSTDSSTGSAETSSSAAAEKEGEAETATTKKADTSSSSVEYAGGGNEANESSGEKMEESKKRAAAKKRKAT